LGWLFLTLLVIGAFGLRLAAVLTLRDWHEGPQFDQSPTADDLEYDHLGWQLA
jgi:hypothetical protein